MDFSTDYIDNIPSIQSQKIGEEFIKQATNFVNSLGTNLSFSEKQKLNRVFYLLKYSNLIVDDFGNFDNRGRGLLQKINKLNLPKEQYETYSRALKEISLLHRIIASQVSTALSNESNHTLENTSYILDFLSHSVHTNHKVTDTTDSDVLIRILSMHLKRLMSKFSNYLEEIDNCAVSSRTDSIGSHLAVYEYIAMWKYGNATINCENNVIILDAQNDFFRAYTANLLDAQWQNNKVLGISAIQASHSRPTYSDHLKSTIYAIADYLLDNRFENLKLFVKQDLSTQNLDFLNKNLHQVTLTKWMQFLVTLKFNVVSSSSAHFVKINWSDYSFLNEKDISNLKDLLSLKQTKSADLFDCPLLIQNGDAFVCPDMIAYFSPASAIRFFMQSDTYWRDLKGENFQLMVTRWLDKSAIKEFEGPIKSNKQGEYEIALVMNFANQTTSIFELKTFTIAHDIKSYRIQLDKVYSNQYSRKSIKNAQYFIDGKGNQKLKFKYHWSHTKLFFISSIVFPSDDPSIVGIFPIYQYALFRSLSSIPQSFLGLTIDQKPVCANIPIPTPNCDYAESWDQFIDLSKKKYEIGKYFASSSVPLPNQPTYSTQKIESSIIVKLIR